MRSLLASLLLLFPILLVRGNGPDTLLPFRELPMKARLLVVDDIGNAYVVRHDNNLVRYNEQGDSTGFFRSVSNGDIAAVDATNPLRLIVYYPEYSRLVLLDRMLAPKSELDLRRLNIFNATVVAGSADGNIWIYDPFNARLKKFNERGDEVSSGNDLRQQLEAVPDPSFMVERERKLFLCDTARGVYVFDQYATYINQLPFTGIRYLQAIDTRLFYRQGYTLISYNLPDAAERMLRIPPGKGKLLQAALVRDKLYVLYEDALRLYRVVP